MSKKIACLLLALVLLLSTTAMTAFAVQPDRTFTYEDATTAVPSTNIYQAKTIIDDVTMGTTKMSNPTDIFVDSQDRVFILDSGNMRVIILDSEYKLIKELHQFKLGDKVHTLAEGAKGLFFRESNNTLYIADTMNDRILVTDLDGNLKTIMEKPEDELMDPTLPYEPSKVIVDNMGIMYVVTTNIHTGALMIDANNRFLGFYGTNKLKLTASMKADFFWRSLLGQNAAENSNQPVQYYNLFWSEDRFVYATSPVVENMVASVVKLNALGEDVFPKSLDFLPYQKATGTVAMQLMDLTVDHEGAVTILDLTNCRLYQFDENCNLLAIFGGLGYQKGLFMTPVSIESDSKKNILVLDAAKCNITVMEQTYYGQMIRTANRLYNEGRYEESIEPWMDVIRMNANYTQAYVGLGKAYIGMGKYEEAMEHFKVGKDKDGYAEAKAALRDETVREMFGLFAAIVIIGMITILGYDQIKMLILRMYWRVRK